MYRNSCCDRCHQETRWTSMSWFNTDMICNSCREIERKHPKYKEAREAEREALTRGDRNFPGVGLPKDLIVT